MVKAAVAVKARQTLILLTLAACLCRSLCMDQDIQAKMITVCPSEEKIDLQCPTGSIIKVENITYGTAVTALYDSCRPLSSGDCSYIETERSYGCNGKEACQIRTNTTRYHNMAVPKCGRRTSYVHVIYLCIPVTYVADMCSPLASQRRSSVGASSGFVGTSGYPRPYTENVTCSYTVFGKRIMLYAVSMYLDSEGDCLMTADDFKGATWCGSRVPTFFENEVLTFSDANILRLHFTSDGHTGTYGADDRQSGSILLYFTAEPIAENEAQSFGQLLTSTRSSLASAAAPRRPTSTQAPPVSPTMAHLPRMPASLVTPQPLHLAGHPGNAPSTEKNQHAASGAAAEKIVIVNNVLASVSNGSQDHTLAMILGIIFGGLSVILMGIIGFYFVKRYKCNTCSRRRRSMSTHQVLLRNATAEQFSNITNDAADSAADSCSEKETADGNTDWKNNLSTGHRSKEYPCKLAVV